MKRSMVTRTWFHMPVLVVAALLESCIGVTSVDELPAELPLKRDEKPAPPRVVQREEPEGKGEIRQVDIGSLFQLREEGRVFLIDVRPAFFFGLGHIPGAISLPLKKFDSQFPNLQSQFDAAREAGRVIVLYCTNEQCPDGLRTAGKLSGLGYSTSVYKGGWKEWKAAGL
ncbi:MAG: rhodanese-like domain-containing protein [Roseibacillus sp.]|nr:rhodanese-like domain-containing protein [Roseibacillus sp.]